MGIIEWLSKFKAKLADIKASIKLDQGGIVNVKVENNNYYLNIPDASPELINKFRSVEFSPEMENEIKKGVENRLQWITEALDAVSDETREEMIIATSISSGFEFIKKL